MAIYKFKAKDAKGEEYEDILEAPNKFALYEKIKKKGDVLISADEEKGKWWKNLKNSLSNLSFFGSVSEQEKIFFARNAAAMLAAGLPLSRTLSVLEKQTKNNFLKNVIVDIQRQISEGGTLTSGLEKHPKVFSPLFVSMVHAGEEGGNLNKSLNTISTQMEKSHDMKRKIKGAFIYPSIIIFVMAVIAVLMVIFVIPSLTEVFDDLDIDLPATTQFVISTSEFLINQTILFIFIVAVFIASLILFLRSSVGKKTLDMAVLHLPMIKNITKELNAARTSRTLSSLLSSGVDMVPALEITEEVLQNSFYKPILKSAGESIQKGKKISEVFIDNEHLYPIFLGEMIEVGEETGNLSEMLEEVAKFFEEEVDQKTKNISTVVEPFLMVFIGIAVGFFAISMLTPMYTMVDQI